jgi:hypothetical protein
MMEKLQILKFCFQNDRLSFTDDLLCTDEELSVIDLDPEVVDELLESGRIEELQEYIEESWKGWGNEQDGDDEDATEESE